MHIHIGQIIREELRRQGHTNEWLADRIHVHPRTVQKIFLKSTIDTQQLLAISQVLGVDFFRLFTLQLTENANRNVRPSPQEGRSLVAAEYARECKYTK